MSANKINNTPMVNVMNQKTTDTRTYPDRKQHNYFERQKLYGAVRELLAENKPQNDHNPANGLIHHPALAAAKNSLNNISAPKKLVFSLFLGGALLATAAANNSSSDPCNSIAHWYDPSCSGDSADLAYNDSDAQDTSASTTPAYSMTIRTYGEGNPLGDNMSPEELQKNRRVDVTIETTEQPEVEEVVQAIGNGVIWATTDPAALTRQMELTIPNEIAIENGKPVLPVMLNVFSNYSAYIDRWEIVVYDGDDHRLGRELKTISGSSFDQETSVDWDGSLDNGKRIDTGDHYLLVLRAYDKKGRMDETFPASLVVDGPDRNITDRDQLEGNTPLLTELALEQRRNRSELAREEIVIRGSRVRIYGRDLGPVQNVTINGEAVTLDADRQFVTEYLLPDGNHDFNVEVTEQNGASYNRKMSTVVDDRYFFATALADITLGQNSVSGNIETLAVDEDDYYGGDIFVDGRLAFYLKGKIRGKYLITAQLDTGRDDVSELFDNLQRKDAESIFRRLDPDQYYPVYGDDSTLIDDTDSQGKVYVRVDWDHSKGIWGNFNTGVTGTEFSQFNRSLYGFQLQSRSNSFAANGEHRTDINVFASEATSAHRHNEFRATGGSLYYLKDQDIVRGSEKIWVEIRSRETSRVVERIEMMAGRDYQIDDFQGRVILNRPLRSIDSQHAPSIIKDEALDGNQVWLIVDYEYVPDDFNPEDITLGARIRQWVTDTIAIGATWIQEQRDGDEHSLQGVDATLRLNNNTYVRAEYAQSQRAQTLGSFSSDDGGLQFSEFTSTALTDTDLEGFAAGITAGADFREWFGFKSETGVEAWAKYREAGYAASGIDTGENTIDAGVELSKHFGDRFRLSARATYFSREDLDSRTTAAVQAEFDVSERVSVAAEVKQVNEEDLLAETDGSGTVAALRAGIDLNNNTNIYAAVQGTISSTGTYESNDRVSLGIKSRANDRLGFNAEVSTGDRGDSLIGGIDYRLDDGSSVYASNELSTDSTQGRRFTTTFGQRKQLTDKTRVYTEHQFSHEDERAGLGHTFGLDYRFNEYVDASLSAQVANYRDAADAEIQRDALSAGIGFKNGRSHGSSKVEVRRDKSDSGNVDQFVTTNSIGFIQSPSLRWQGRLNHSTTDDNRGIESDASFTEAGIGVAVRPVSHDKLNMLGRLTAQHDLPPLSQSDRTDERSVTGSLELAYQLNQLWEVGGKVAYKNAQIRTDRAAGDWDDNDASLAAARIRYHLLFRWDALAEYHWLNSQAAEDTEHGFLFAVGRNVGNNLNLSVGYNFTSFDDNLLNDSTDVDGWFLNLVGKY